MSAMTSTSHIGNPALAPAGRAGVAAAAAAAAPAPAAAVAVPRRWRSSESPPSVAAAGAPFFSASFSSRSRLHTQQHNQRRARGGHRVPHFERVRSCSSDAERLCFSLVRDTVKATNCAPRE
jgi:hypothetical protein